MWHIPCTWLIAAGSIEGQGKAGFRGHVPASGCGDIEDEEEDEELVEELVEEPVELVEELVEEQADELEETTELIMREVEIGIDTISDGEGREGQPGSTAPVQDRQEDRAYAGKRPSAQFAMTPDCHCETRRIVEDGPRGSGASRRAA